MRPAPFLIAAMLTTADLRAADDPEQHQIEVRISIYFDLSGEEAERLTRKMTALDGCKVSIAIIGRENVTTTRPLSWPSAFEPGATFAVGVHFPHHRQEVRCSVSGVGACSPAALDDSVATH
jgi:hypothetical protein